MRTLINKDMEVIKDLNLTYEVKKTNMHLKKTTSHFSGGNTFKRNMKLLKNNNWIIVNVHLTNSTTILFLFIF